MPSTSVAAPPTWERVQSAYMLPPGLVYLNNGTAGPTPRRVVEKTAAVTAEIDGDPTRLHVRMAEALGEAKGRLASFVGAQPKDLVFCLNVTVGMNFYARGLNTLRPGDEILTTDQEYGAVTNIWEFVAARRGCTVRRVAIPQPPPSPEYVVELLLGSVTDRTRVILVSHITTTTGQIFPLREIAAGAHERGILVAVDGAHAPGMIPVDLTDLDCDFYTGNCHKWLCGPKGTGFAHVSPRAQGLLDPLIVGWGWTPGKEETFLGNFENPGTHNPAPWIGVAEAVAFQEEIGKERIAARGRELAEYGKDIFSAMPGVKLLTSRDPRQAGSIASYLLPPAPEGAMQKALERRKLWAIAGTGPEGGRMRLSTHIYNTEAHVDLLAEAFRETYGL